MASRTRILFAFAAVYVIWGSTYLAIRLAIATLPPMLMAGGRLFSAGAILYAAARARGAPAPERGHWLPAVVTGALMLLVGNGGVVLAERTVPSSLAALVIAAVPLWMALLESLREGVWPAPGRALALVVGFVAVGVLVGPGALHGGDAVSMGLLLLSAPAWAVGSLYWRRAPRPASGLIGAALQMLCGGGLMLVVGTALGEWSDLHVEQLSASSVAAFLYLVVFGSIVAFTAYSWLLNVVSPTLVSTYAYVNPVVAVLLGWALAGEPIGARTLAAAAAIVGSVVLITARRPPVRVRA
jgi:drug/metabolite transporter (DMT)-like permease